MRTRYVGVLAVAVFGFTASVHANPVAHWNAIATQIATSEERSPVPPAHALAMVHVAMFEVLNFLERRYPSQYFVHPASAVNLSRPAAVSAAAHFMLVEFYPHRKAQLDAALRNFVGADERSAEIQGRALAMNLYALRSLVLDQSSRSPASALSWNPIVAELAAARRLSLIETARLHALVSTTVLRAYDTDVHTILDAEFGSAQAGREIDRSALVQFDPLR